MWFRRDLRLKDNPALEAALRFAEGNIICLYVHEQTSELRRPGGASAWWLDKSLHALRQHIEKRGGQLVLRAGEAASCINQVIAESGATAVFWNRRYDAAGRAIDAAIKTDLKRRGIEVQSFKGSLLTEPWSVMTKTGQPYRVFTPYWKTVRAHYQPHPAHTPPEQLHVRVQLSSDTLENWQLHPRQPDWSGGLQAHWTPGEAGAEARLRAFLDRSLNRYDTDRNRPDLSEGTSSLSPHLAHGEIGPAQIWRAVMAKLAMGETDPQAADVFLSELVWREFSYVLLYHYPDLASQNYNRKFDRMEWHSDAEPLKAWQSGMTGYPIVDAGMRQLWQTGWMHNRVRMIVASFLTKHLMQDWRAGEAWFWDTLVDADPGANSASWQWVAGCGADAAPYFRVFNPILQGEKFDQTGGYVCQWCPELKKLPRKYLYQPWSAPPEILSQADIRLGETYPRPIVIHKAARERALEAYARLKESEPV